MPRKPAKKPAAKKAAKTDSPPDPGAKRPRLDKPAPDKPLQDAAPPPAPADPRPASAVEIIAQAPDLVTRAVSRNPDLIPPDLRRDPRLDALVPQLNEVAKEAQELLQRASAHAGRVETLRRIIRRSPMPDR